MEKVNLFMVGAMKAGTTTLTGLFSEHPEVYTSPIKEPHYFVKDLPKNLYEPSRFFSENNYFENEFPKPVHIAHLNDPLQYLKLFSLATSEKYLLDASTAYLHAPDAADNIFAYNPEAKIVILRRDPIKRAFSHYKMDLGLGRTTRSFQAIMEEEIAAYKNGNLAWNTYLAMSFYTKAIARFKELFSEVLVVDFEKFVQDPSDGSRVITDFLGISNLEDAQVEHKNETKALRFQKLFFVLKKLGIKDYFSKIFSAKFRQRIFGMMSTSEKQPMNLSESIKEELTVIFNTESSL